VDHATIERKYNGFFEKSIFYKDFFEMVVNFARQLMMRAAFAKG